MTKLKLDSALSGHAEAAMEDLRGRLYSRPGMRVMAVVELAHTERTQPAPDEDKVGSVKLAVKLLEVARGDQQEDQLRQVMAALQLQRTAQGTFDEELGQLQLSQSTLDDCADRLSWIETARLRAALADVGLMLDRIDNATWSQKQQRDAVSKLRRHVRAALEWREDEPPQ